MLNPVSGCKIYIGTPLDEKSTDFVAADFASITWTEITKWTQMGDLGDEANSIPIQIIGEGRDKVQGGTSNAGMMQNVFASVPTDPGQQALAAALKINTAFKIELNDKPASGASPKNSLRYFVGMPMSVRETGGAANTIRNLNANVAVNSNVVRVAASAT